MRQAGILAAAGIWALEHNLARLADDHRRAKRLAQALSELPGIMLDPARVQTNIIIFGLNRPGLDVIQLMVRLKEQGVLILPISPTELRAVTHLDVDDQGIDQAIGAFRKILG